MLGALDLNGLDMVSADAAEKLLGVLLSILCSLFFRNWSMTCSAWKDARNLTQFSNVDGPMSS
jgi:hypothetical protein